MDECAPSPKPRVRVRLVGDVACPWTFLTVQTLLEAFGDALDLLWHPYLLREGARRVSEAQAVTLSAAAATTGHALPHPDAARLIDSPLCHANLLALQAAAGPEPMAKAVNALTSAAFVAGAPLASATDIEAALAPVSAIKLDPAAGMEAVLHYDRQARTAGIRDIPVVIVADQHVIAGWQPAKAFLALNTLAEVGELWP